MNSIVEVKGDKKLSVSGLEKILAMTGFLADNVETTSKQFLIQAAEKIVSEARSNLQTNANIDSGALLESIKILEQTDEYIIVGSDSDYAGIIEFGRGPVFPNDPDGWLHWIDKDTGKDVFAKKSKSVEPQPFMQPAVSSIELEFPTVMAREYNERIKEA